MGKYDIKCSVQLFYQSGETALNKATLNDDFNAAEYLHSNGAHLVGELPVSKLLVLQIALHTFSIIRLGSMCLGMNPRVSTQLFEF